MDYIEFAKLSGSGNDFICIDTRDGRYDDILASPVRAGHLAATLCHRGMGIGADGLIFACQPEIEGVSDIAARFFEPDGSESQLCGNGTGCFIHWVIESGWAEDGLKILTPAGVVIGEPSDGKYIRVCIPDPEDIRINFEVRTGDSLLKCDHAVTGVPHLIHYVDDVAAVDLPHLGPLLRYHEQFAPGGVNANFVQVIDEGHLAIRTWEFGVEGETLACGTGSAAAAILAAIHFDWPCDYRCGDKPVLVDARSGDTLRVYFNNKTGDESVSDVCLETIVRFVCRGRVHPDLTGQALNGALNIATGE